MVHPCEGRDSELPHQQPALSFGQLNPGREIDDKGRNGLRNPVSSAMAPHQAEQHATFIPCNAIFPEAGTDFASFKDLVASLSLTDALLWCGRLNLVLTDPAIPAAHTQTYVADVFLSNEERRRAEAYHREHPASRTILFRGQIMELLRWIVLLCEDHPNDGATFDDEAVRRRFIQAALIAGDLWSKRVQVPYLKAPASPAVEDIEAARDGAMGSIRASVEGSRPAMRLWAALGRGRALFGKHLRIVDPLFEPAFQASTGLTLDDYHLAQAALMSPFEDLLTRMRSPNNVLFRLTDFNEAPALRGKVTRLLELESQTADQLKDALWEGIDPNSIQTFEDAPPYRDLALRKRPIFRAADGRMVVLDAGFLKDRLAVGPYFYYLRAPWTDEGHVLRTFGRAFELYACEALQWMFPTAAGLVERLTCNVQEDTSKGQVELYDACLNDGEEVAIFEATAKFIRDDHVLPADPTAPGFEDELREKYGPKLEQLATSITEVIEANKGGEFTACRLVYPVLLVYDHRLSTPGMGNWFQRRFNKMLAPEAVQPSGHMLKGRLRIAPLITMSIDTLEHLETSIRQFGFRELLKDYTDAHQDRTTPLWNFLASDGKYRDRIRSSARLERYQQEVGDMLMSHFPAELLERLSS